MASGLRDFRRGQSVYLAHVISLFLPGHGVPVFKSDQLGPQNVQSWDKDELKLLIEEGRRQIDRQQSDLEHIRGRAQWLFTVGAAVSAALGTGMIAAYPHGAIAVLWLVALLLLVYGIGGAAAILTVKADFRTVHTAVLSGLEQPVEPRLAAAYAGMMSTGENTVATRLTIFRHAVVFCLAGGYLGLVAALLGRACCHP